MSRLSSLFFLNLIFTLLFLFIFDYASSSCQTKCGEIEIPYPFGIGEGCYLNKWYEIQCSNDSTTLLTALGKKVVHISLAVYWGGVKSYGSIRIKNPIASKGCSSNDAKEEHAAESLLNLTDSPFYVSYINTLVAVGCNITASLTNVESSMVRCNSSCGTTHPSTPTQNYLEFISCRIKLNNGDWGRHCDARSIQNETICNGIGCCQVSIPDKLQQVVGVSIDEKTTNSGGGCKVAFLTNDAYSIKHKSDPKLLHDQQYSTVELGWFIPTTNVSFIDSLKCKHITDEYYGYKSCLCEYSADSSYASCACRHGYRGNPYIPSGCKEYGCLFDFYPVNDCKHPIINREMMIVTVVAFVSLIFIGGIYVINKCIKICKRIYRKKKFFKRNGGLLLQQHLITTEGNVEKTRIFSSKELEKATENFSVNRVLGQGGQGTVYKGMLKDGGIVAVKKSKVVDEDKLEEFINEVVILSQINHRNIVKLLGCCLETEVPMLVYEFISNGNLFDHLHDDFDDYTMITWEVRLRFAEDIAGALSYLHSAASLPIYHRDIKSTNIMLDEKYRAKVADFGTSRSVTVDHTHLTTVVSGTVGYVDPEYFHSSQFTDKSDVYSFGVVLVELITGAKPISFLRSQENRSLATYFILAMKENRLDEIIDARIKEESKLAQITATAKLARRCLNLKGRKRPSMREVSMELERIRSSHGDSELVLASIIESDEEEEVMEVNIDVVESWNNVAVTDNIATSFVDAEPLFPRQTW